MKKTIFLLLIPLLTIFLGIEVEAQHPLGEGQVLVGNGYYAPSDKGGDGTWRYAQIRWLPLSNQMETTRFGLYLSGIEVKSMINGYLHHSTEFGIGVAVNFTLTPGNMSDRYAWLNTAYKVVNSTGKMYQGADLYQNKQKDKMLYLDGGMLFRNIILQAPFAQQKIMIEMQTALNSTQTANWNADTLIGVPWNRERFKVQAENGIVPIYLGWSHITYLMPSIIAAYTYETGNKASFYSVGIGITLAKGQYGHEILSMSYQPMFWAKGPRIDSFQIHLDLVNLFRKSN
ncbi:MAG: hypothetical protein Q8Q67_03140 [bacterium]|nr:hypothetical protein [bacterium]